MGLLELVPLKTARKMAEGMLFETFRKIGSICWWADFCTKSVIRRRNDMVGPHQRIERAVGNTGTVIARLVGAKPFEQARPKPATSHGRVAYIDGWRAVAVLMVAATHLAVASGHPLPIDLGRTGVHIFFLISGYIITSMSLSEIQRTGRFSQTNFMVRRAMRILPPLALYICVSLLVNWQTFALLWLPAVRAVTFTCNIDFATDSGCFWQFGHTWSLAFEEQFYLLFPFILLRRINLWLIPALAIWLMPFFAPLSYLSQVGSIQVATLFGLGMGYAYRKTQVDAWLAKLPLVAFALPLAFMAWWLYRPGPLQGMFSLLEPLAIFAIVFGIPAKSMTFRNLMDNIVMRQIGLYSYTIYLWQQMATQQREGWTPWHYVAGLVLVGLISWVSWNTYEAVFRKWSARFKSI